MIYWWDFNARCLLYILEYLAGCRIISFMAIDECSMILTFETEIKNQIWGFALSISHTLTLIRVFLISCFPTWFNRTAPVRFTRNGKISKFSYSFFPVIWHFPIFSGKLWVTGKRKWDFGFPISHMGKLIFSRFPIISIKFLKTRTIPIHLLLMWLLLNLWWWRYIYI